MELKHVPFADAGTISVRFQPATPMKPRTLDEDEIADFIEPATFDWDEDVYAALEAAKKYSEQITRQ